MSKFFITDDGQLVEVIEHTVLLQAFTPIGPISQPHTKHEFRYIRVATEEDRQRVPQSLGVYA